MLSVTAADFFSFLYADVNSRAPPSYLLLVCSSGHRSVDVVGGKAEEKTNWKRRQVGKRNKRQDENEGNGETGRSEIS